MRRSRAAVVGRVHAAAACLLAGALAACVDGSPVGVSADAGATVLLAPVVGPASAPFLVDAPITRARLTARDAASGATYGTATVELDPAAAEWTLPLMLDVPAGADTRVVVTIELLSLIDGQLVVQWSGLTAPLAVVPGVETNEVHQVPLYRGPPEDLTVTSVELVDLPASVTEGDRFRAVAAVAGGGEGATVYFGSLDPAVATVDASGLVTTLGRGTARIIAVAGPSADTAAVEVGAWPLPERAVVDAIDPGLDDAASRILPSLVGDAPSASTLRTLLDRIRSALADRLGLAAEQALTQARQALAGYGGGGAPAVADGPELSVVGLVLDHVERILNAAR